MNELLRHFLMMGVDAPVVSTLSPYSAVKYIDRAVCQCIGQWLSAEGMPKHQTLGLADGFTGVEFHAVGSIFDWIFTGELSDDIIMRAREEAIRHEKLLED